MTLSKILSVQSWLFLCAGILFVTAFACRSSEDSSAAPDSITGIVRVIGNEPFARLAVETGDGVMHPVRASSDIEQLLLGNQGKHVRARVARVTDSPDGRVYELSSAEITKE